MKHPRPVKPGPGQESVWEYPRPPRLERSSKTIRVVFNDIEIARTTRSFRVLETSHPPTYYIPPEDIRMEYLYESARVTFCEWKGRGHYYDVRVGEKRAPQAGWFYPTPTGSFAELANCVAFYVSKMDACYVDDERVRSQPGDFYGGWVTDDIVGPFKGEPGTWGW